MNESQFTMLPGGRLNGTIRVPGDKSMSHRSIMLASLADGVTDISGFLEGEDSLATCRAFQQMGVKVEARGPGQLRVTGVGMHGLKQPAEAIDLGNSGTAMRLMMGVLAGQSFDTVLTGDASLRSRPMGRVIKPLMDMGAEIHSNEGTAPLKISGGTRLKGMHYPMPIASAQVKSAILLAGLFADGQTCVVEPAPTRDHTERMLRGFGYEVNAQGDTACLRGGGQLIGTQIEVPGDISSAAFFLVGALIAPGSELTLEHVGVNPTRTGVIDILRAMGGQIELLNQREIGGEPVADIRVSSSQLTGITVPQGLVPLAIDEFPAIAVAAACAQGVTRISGAEELRVKESDRISAIVNGLRAIGIDAEEQPDGMVINGGIIGGGTVDSLGDHRIAMAFSMAALQAQSGITITDCDNVATSFPGYVSLATSAGLRFSVGGQNSNIPILTIDGPSGVGKGTVAKLIAQKMGWHYLDSGALYRILAYAAKQSGVSLDSATELATLAEAIDIAFGDQGAMLDGAIIESEIRSEQMGNSASIVAQHPEVRKALLAKQQQFAEAPGLVADGRDMGTTVFPQADRKIFMTATVEERAKRRSQQLSRMGLGGSIAALCREIATRDERDANRAESPLRPAEDAIVLDTTPLSIEQAVEAVAQSLDKCIDSDALD